MVRTQSTSHDDGRSGSSTTTRGRNLRTSSSSKSSPSYANVTLSSGSLSAVVYLPDGIKPDEPTYYKSSRFDWSSNIGTITTRRQGGGGGGGNGKQQHVLYGSDMWRQPHDPESTEAGVGLASEFGVGDDGSFCNFQCGWHKDNEVTNGVLGYDQAAVGDSFLKIGVGALIKGSCPDCDPTSIYKFNSEYEFARPPVWRLTENDDNKGSSDGSSERSSIRLWNEEVLHEYGYRIVKDVTLTDDQLLITTTLTNIGRVPMATAWYSHNLFTCDSKPVGPGYSVDLDLPNGGDFFEPGFMSWSSPIEDFATISHEYDSGGENSHVNVNLERPVEDFVKLKAEFARDDDSHGGFTLHGCQTNIHESFPDVGKQSGPSSLYAYNLYIEQGTLSPEVQLFLHLNPGETKSWRQQLDFTFDDEDRNDGNYDDAQNVASISSFSLLRSITIRGRGIVSNVVPISQNPFMVLVMTTMAVTCGFALWMYNRSRNSYTSSGSRDFRRGWSFVTNHSSSSSRVKRSQYEPIP